jgi:hypothetical protein
MFRTFPSKLGAITDFDPSFAKNQPCMTTLLKPYQPLMHTHLFFFGVAGLNSSALSGLMKPSS